MLLKKHLIIINAEKFNMFVKTVMHFLKHSLMNKTQKNSIYEAEIFWHYKCLYYHLIISKHPRLFIS